MSAAEPRGETAQYPLIIIVKFDPPSLPRGMVDAADFGDFLDGLQLALAGQIEYDLQTNYIANGEQTHYRLVLAAVRQSSVDAYLIAQVFNYLTPQAMRDLQVLLAELISLAGGTTLAVSVLRKYLEAIAQEVGKKHGEYLADKLDLQRIGLYIRHFLDHLRAFASGYRDGETALPPPLVISMAPGMKKMAEVGAKSDYQNSGNITVFDDAEAEKVIPFNADTQRNIATVIDHARKTEEQVALVGRVDEPSDRYGTFVLTLPNTPVRSRYVRCKASKSQDRALIRSAYMSGSLVRISGVRRPYAYPSSTGKPRGIVIVTYITVVDENTLWDKPEPLVGS